MIKVKTPIGTTEEADTGATLGQGTIEGTILSSTSLSKGVEDFLDDENETNYGNVVVKELLFQDDIASASKSVETAQRKNKKVEALLETKLLDLNETKTVFMILGSRKYKEETRKKLDETPLVLNNKPMKEVEKYSYLGEVVSSQGLSACNTETISKRIGINLEEFIQLSKYGKCL